MFSTLNGTVFEKIGSFFEAVIRNVLPKTVRVFQIKFKIQVSETQNLFLERT